ncbi:hypothetical protein RRF57_009219 [Xylaria bambusicola]|uniref:Uncharacterized protein n=1 Tax=Xylaria bambusicola TaxID=326684 RepID=A0AAN7UJ76_9PEZI
MAAVEQAPQPDFHVLSRHLQGMAIEVDRCSNLVGLHNTNAILHAITELTNTVNTSVAELRNERQTIRNEMRDMGRSLELRLNDLWAGFGN